MTEVCDLRRDHTCEIMEIFEMSTSWPPLRLAMI